LHCTLRHWIQQNDFMSKYMKTTKYKAYTYVARLQIDIHRKHPTRI
jgi:hypothetical protein